MTHSHLAPLPRPTPHSHDVLRPILDIGEAKTGIKRLSSAASDASPRPPEPDPATCNSPLPRGVTTLPTLHDDRKLTIPARMTPSERESFGKRLFDTRINIIQTREYGGAEKQFDAVWAADETPVQRGASGLPQPIAVVTGVLMSRSTLRPEHVPHASGLPGSTSVLRMTSTGHRTYPVGAMNEPKVNTVANLQAVVLIVPVVAATQRKLPWANSTEACLGVKVLLQAAKFNRGDSLTWNYGTAYDRGGEYTPGDPATLVKTDVIDLSLKGLAAAQGWQ